MFIKSIHFLPLTLLLASVLFLPVGVFGGPNDPVNIPDATLRTAIETALGVSAGDPITESQMAGLTTLSARRVEDLTGLEHATGLRELELSFSAISDLTPLGGLTALTKLVITFSRISDLTPLGGLTALTELEITGGPVSDLTPLQTLTALTKLTINGGFGSRAGKVVDLSPLSGLTRLTYLALERHKIEDIRPLTTLTALERLSLFTNPLTDISIFADNPFPNLKSLNIEDTWVRDFSPLDPNYWVTKYDPNDLSDETGTKLLICSGVLLDALNTVNDPSAVLQDTTKLKEQLDNPVCAPVFTLESTTDNTSVRLVVNAAEDLTANYVTLTYVYRYRKSGGSWPQESQDTFTPQWTGGFVNPPPGEDTAPNYQGVIELENNEYAAEITGLDPSAVYHFQVFGSALQSGNIRLIYPPGSEEKCWSTSEQSVVACPLLVRQTLARQGRAAEVSTRGPNRIPDSLAFRGQIAFSELMFDVDDDPDALPQWIELCNISQTETVNLWNWKLEIEMCDAEGEHRHAVVRLNNLQILPNETALIVTSDAPNSANLKKWSVYKFFEHHPNAFRDNKSQNKVRGQNRVLGQKGFFLRLSHPTDGVSDVVGNLDGNGFTADEVAWELPSGTIDNDVRTSLMRHYQHGKQVFPDGKTSSNWQQAADVALEVMTYWGKETDIGNPGRKAGWRFPDSDISFSELMFASKGGLHSLPQWIELYNASETGIVDLADWQLEIEARDANGEHRYAVITLDRFLIQPRQTVLMVTWSGRNSGNILKDRVYYLTSRIPHTFERNTILGESGFFLRLSDPEGITRDIVGNLDGNKLTEDTPKWKLPSGITDDDARTSLMRRYERLTSQPFDGRKSRHWVPASKMALRVSTYWGRNTDIGNPGYGEGNPLPVRLSSFRAGRADTGSVIIKWTTASEIDNAGFNILRSQSRKGRFVRINAKLIAGAGTTSERHTYTWTDTTAKPNTTYYYLLEDVSFSGNHRQLATVRLRGIVSARGKLMTTWGGLKRQR